MPLTRLVDYLASSSASDLYSGASIAGTTWTQIGPDWTFTLTATSSVMIALQCGCIVGANNGNGASAALNLDGTRYSFSNVTLTGDYQNPVNSTMRLFPALVAGSHTLKLEIYLDVGLSLYLRQHSQVREFLAVQIDRLDAGSSSTQILDAFGAAA